MLKIVRTTTWNRPMAGPQSGGMDGRVTHVVLGRSEGYVRENFRCDTFREMTSGTRKAATVGAYEPGVQVLELAAFPSEWGKLANAVIAADPLHRPVVQNRRWTVAAARQLFARQEASHDA